MTKLPRDLTGERVVRALERLGVYGTLRLVWHYALQGDLHGDLHGLTRWPITSSLSSGRKRVLNSAQA